MEAGDRGEADRRGEIGDLRGDPQGEMASRRMTEHYGARRIATVLRGVLAGEGHGEFHVVEGAGPAAAGFADAAVFDVGGGESGNSEGLAHRSGMQEIVADAPESSVNHDDERTSCAVRGAAEIYELTGLVPVILPHSVMRLTSRMCGLDD